MSSNLASIQNSFKGDLITQSYSDYAAAIKRWAPNASRAAAVVAFVKDAQDVALVIKYAKENGLPVAVHSGGHTVSGANSSEGGLVIDLSKYVTHVRVDAENKLVYVGGGSTWTPVDQATIEYGLATMSGSCGRVGVAGSVLQGGYGWQTGTHGLAIDNLVQVTIVTADCSILTASKSENPDLFWAIRGGGGNFGVVTEFVLALHPQRRTVFCGPLIFLPNALEKLVPLVQEWLKGQKEEEFIAQYITRGPDKNPCIVLTLFYNGSEAEGRANFKAFYELGPIMDQTKEIPYEIMGTTGDAFLTPGCPSWVRATPQPAPSLEAAAKAFDRVIALTSSPEYADLNINLLWEYYNFNKANSIPDDETALKRGVYPTGLAYARWEGGGEVDFEYLKNSVEEIGGILASANDGYPGKYSPLNYLVYKDIETKDGVVIDDVARAVYGDNYPKLQRLKKKYDPEMVFAKGIVITPAA